MSPLRDLIPFIFSQCCWTGMQTEGLRMLLSIYKAECMVRKQHQLLVYFLFSSRVISVLNSLQVYTTTP